MLTFILEVLTALLLAITLCIQSVSVIISLDSVISGLFKTISRHLSSVMYSTYSAMRSELERKAVSNAFVNFYANIFWTFIAYKVSVEAFRSFFLAPMIYFGVLTSFVQIYIVRNEVHVQNFWNRQMLYSLLSILLYSIIKQCYVVSFRSLPVMFLLLKYPINSFFQGVDLLRRLSLHGNNDDEIIFIPPTVNHPQAAANNNNDTPVATSASNNGYAAFDNDFSYLLEILRLSIWSFISFYEYSICLNVIVSPASLTMTAAQFPYSEHYNDRKNKWFYLLVLFHDLINLFTVMKKFIQKRMKEIYIRNKFPKINEEELRNLSEDDRCAICLCDHNQSTVRLPCQHLLHAQCLNRILQGSDQFHPALCPICRSEIMTSANNENGNGTAGEGEAGGVQGAAEFNVIRIQIVSPRNIRLSTSGITTSLNNLSNNNTPGNHNHNNNSNATTPATTATPASNNRATNPFANPMQNNSASRANAVAALSNNITALSQEQLMQLLNSLPTGNNSQQSTNIPRSQQQQQQQQQQQPPRGNRQSDAEFLRSFVNILEEVSRAQRMRAQEQQQQQDNQSSSSHHVTFATPLHNGQPSSSLPAHLHGDNFVTPVNQQQQQPTTASPAVEPSQSEQNTSSLFQTPETIDPIEPFLSRPAQSSQLPQSEATTVAEMEVEEPAVSVRDRKRKRKPQGDEEENDQQRHVDDSSSSTNKKRADKKRKRGQSQRASKEERTSPIPSLSASSSSSSLLDEDDGVDDAASSHFVEDRAAVAEEGDNNANKRQKTDKP